ncbi:MAG: EAL domain-containing protein, partial [Pseudomonadales bacterium]|nr:EAL domain-containing protein [Pseudomonadales bacterium]
MNDRRLCLRALLLLLSCLSPSPVYSKEIVVKNLPVNKVVDHQEHFKPIYVGWVEDEVEENTIDEALSSNLNLIDNGSTLNFGVTESSFWIFVLVEYVGEYSKKELLLEIPFPLLQELTYYLDSERIGDFGFSRPWLSRMLAHKHFVIPLKLQKNESKLLAFKVSANGGSLQFPMSFWEIDSFIENNGAEYFSYGVFFGALAAMLVYNIFLFLRMRSRVYAFYVLYLSISIVCYLSLTGFGFQYVWWFREEINIIASPLSSCLTAISALLFFTAFTSLKRLSGRLNTIAISMSVCGMIFCLVTLYTKMVFGLFVLGYVAMACTLVLFTSVHLVRKGSREAAFFLVAWLLFVVGVIVFLLMLSGFLPSNVITRNSLPFGAITEVMLLSFALGDKIKREKRGLLRALEKKMEASKRLLKAEKRFKHRQKHSIVTGLPKSELLQDRIKKHISCQLARGILVFISINNFKDVNRTLGLENGNIVLRLVSERINGHISARNGSCKIGGRAYLAHLRGVVFGAYFTDVSLESVYVSCQDLLKIMSTPFEYQGVHFLCEISIGIAQYPVDALVANDLIKKAYVAVGQSALSGIAIETYSESIERKSSWKYSIASELKYALDRNQIYALYQPKICLKENSVVGAEMLLRWEHPKYGNIPPVEFIPLAERVGLIDKLTYWLGLQAKEAYAEFQNLSDSFCLAINVSAKSISNVEFMTSLVDVLEISATGPTRYIFEVTENIALTDVDNTIVMMKELTRKGASFSVDDFGTGYSSIAYLKKLPVSEVKIDRSFIRGVSNNKDDRVIVNTALK